MTKIWLGLGVTIEVPDEQADKILAGDADALMAIVSGKDGKWYVDGETYIPHEVAEQFGREEVNFELSADDAVADRDPAPALSSEYWDCECDEQYIHHNSVAECRVCWARRDEMPDSRQSEVDEGAHFGA